MNNRKRLRCETSRLYTLAVYLAVYTIIHCKNTVQIGGHISVPLPWDPLLCLVGGVKTYYNCMDTVRTGIGYLTDQT